MAGQPDYASLAGVHPRAGLLARTLGPAYGRAFGRARPFAYGAAFVAGFVATPLLPLVAAAVVGAAAAAATFALVATALIPLATRQAQEVFAWLARAEAPTFVGRTGGRIPRKREWRAWLAAHPAGTPSPYPRIEVLGMLGELERAKAELAAAPPPADDEERLDAASYAWWLDWLAGGSPDLAPLSALVATMAGGPLGLRARGVRAITEARLRLSAGDPHWEAPLAAFRPALGRQPTEIVLRDLYVPRLLNVVLVGFIAGLFGAAVALVVRVA